MDDEGFLYFVGRRDNMIKSSGFRISPTEVEEALFTSGQVREAAVIGIPDEILGQAIKAVVVLRPGERLDAAYIKAECRRQLANYKIPKVIEFSAALPYTASGKLQRLHLG